MSGPRVLVCGGREFADDELLLETLDALHGATTFGCLMHGGANGADTLAGSWAANKGIDTIVFPAGWSGLGSFAGPRRNAFMLKEGRPTLVVAFPGGAGTEDMVRKAKRAGVRVILVEGSTMSVDDSPAEVAP